MDERIGQPAERLTVDLPARVTAVVDGLVTRGAPVWLVGGSVRDALLGLAFDDFDLCSTLPVAAAAATLTRCGLTGLQVDERLGVVLGRLPEGGGLAIGRLREEADYGPDRRPSWVRFIDRPERDALRRDFTVNALYARQPGGELLDPTGGVADLRARRLRMVGDPRQRLAEDPLRILRALRFAAGRGLRIEPRTEAALRALAGEVAQLSGERRRDELFGTLRSGGDALRALHDTGVLGHAAPSLCPVGLAAGSAAVIEGRAAALDALCSGPPAVVWAAAMRGLDAAAVAAAGKDLELGAELRRSIGGLLSAGDAEEDELPGVVDALRSLPVADRDAALGILWGEVVRARVAADEEISRLPGLDGRAVLAAGVPAGPDVGAVLRAARRALLRGGGRDPASVRAAIETAAETVVKRGGRHGR